MFHCHRQYAHEYQLLEAMTEKGFNLHGLLVDLPGASGWPYGRRVELHGLHGSLV